MLINLHSFRKIASRALRLTSLTEAIKTPYVSFCARATSLRTGEINDRLLRHSATPPYTRAQVVHDVHTQMRAHACVHVHIPHTLIDSCMQLLTPIKDINNCMLR